MAPLNYLRNLYLIPVLPVLHLSWFGNHFQLWASSHELSSETPLVEESLSPDLTTPLFKVLSEQDLFTYEKSSFEITRHYRGGGVMPIDSSCRLNGLALVDLLSSFDDELREEYRYSSTIIFWRRCAKLLLEGVARGFFYPGVARKGASLESRWNMFVQDDEYRRRISSLMSLMPGVANQYFLLGRSVEDNNFAAVLSFFEVTADEIIRSFLSTYSLLVGSLNSSSTSPEDTLEHVKLKISRRDLLIIQWLNSLSSRESMIDISVADQNTLERLVADWNAPLRSLQEAPTPTPCIRIEPPDTDTRADMLELPWRIIVSLKLNEVPGQTHAEEQLLQQIEFNDYHLIKEGGKLKHLLPVIDNLTLRGDSLTQLLTANQAYAVLERHRKALEEVGFTVIAPEWWSETRKTIGVVVKIKPMDETLSDTAFNIKNLVKFSWALKIGEEEVSLDRFEEMLDDDKPLMFIGGQWVALDPKAIRDNILHLKSVSAGQNFTLFDALRLGVSGVNELGQLDLVRIDAEGWIQRILEFGKGAEEDRRVPDSFHGTLRPYQEVGLAWLSFLSRAGVGGCLADDMGLGKTIQVLALLAKEKETRQSQTPNLLVVPMSIVGNWEAEALKFVPSLKVYVHHGPFRLQDDQFVETAFEADLVVTTYSILHRDYNGFRRVPWYRIILDEAQNVKNTDAKQTKAVRALVDELSRAQVGTAVTSSEVAELPDVYTKTGGPLRLALTGTPLENRLQELWSILDFINPGLLGSAEDFRKNFVNPIERSKEPQITNALGKLIKPFILRRVKTDPEIAADLPEKIEIESVVHLTAEQAKLYSATLQDMLPKVRESEGIHRKGAILSVITKLKQICIHPALLLKDGSNLSGRSGKLDMLEDLLDTLLAEGDRMLIFTQFAQWGHLLSPYLAEKYGIEVPFFHGGLNRAARESIVSRFQSENGPPILVLSLKAGGFGLNLTRANQVIHMDQWWNPAVQNQATDRAYRIGQKVTVQVRNLISKGTLEEKINQLHKEKIELANAIVGTTRNVITELTPQALEELLTLQTTVLMEG